MKATQIYLDLFKYSPPGTKTGSWDESTGAFLSGQVALLVESTPLSGEAIDPKVSKQVGTPREIFERPDSQFVAAFIRTPAMNFFEVDVNGSELNAAGRNAPPLF